MHCPYCGFQISSNEFSFCPSCGKQIDEIIASVSKNSAAATDGEPTSANGSRDARPEAAAHEAPSGAAAEASTGTDASTQPISQSAAQTKTAAEAPFTPPIQTSAAAPAETPNTAPAAAWAAATAPIATAAATQAGSAYANTNNANQGFRSSSKGAKPQVPTAKAPGQKQPAPSSDRKKILIIAGIAVAIIVVMCLAFVLGSKGCSSSSPTSNNSNTPTIDKTMKSTFESKDGTVKVTLPNYLVRDSEEEDDQITIFGYIDPETQSGTGAMLCIRISALTTSSFITLDEALKASTSFYDDKSGKIVDDDLSCSSGSYAFKGLLLKYQDNGTEKYTYQYIAEHDGAYWEVDVLCDADEVDTGKQLAEAAMANVTFKNVTKSSNTSNNTNTNKNTNKNSNTNSNTNKNTNTSLAGFDMSQGSYIDSNDCYVNNYFKVYFPFAAHYVWSDTSVSIYYKPCMEAGAGGRIGIIQAYAVSDESYKQLPKYHVLGTKNGIRYVAIHPTDVQYDSAHEAEWRQAESYFTGLALDSKDSYFMML